VEQPGAGHRAPGGRVGEAGAEDRDPAVELSVRLRVEERAGVLQPLLDRYRPGPRRPRDVAAPGVLGMAAQDRLDEPLRRDRVVAELAGDGADGRRQVLGGGLCHGPTLSGPPDPR
jgi:hypothetical protein